VKGNEEDGKDEGRVSGKGEGSLEGKNSPSNCLAIVVLDTTQYSYAINVFPL